jgi:integrase
MKLPKHVRAVRKTRADGSIATYYYHRGTNTRLPDPTDPTFTRKLVEAGRPESRWEHGTLGALILEYQRSHEWQIKRQSTQRHELHVMKALERFSQLEVKAISRQWIVRLRGIITTDRGVGAANAFGWFCRMLFSWARNNGWIEHSPLDRLESVKGAEHLPAWTNEQYNLALAAFPEPLRRVLILGRYTGQRRGDLIAMQWSHYDGRTIRVTQQKTGEKLIIPTHTTLRAALDAWKREATSTRILTSASGIPWQDTYLSRYMGEWRDKLELPKRLNVHGLRKLAAISLAEAGCTPHQIAAITGHRTLAMVQLYTRDAHQPLLAEQAMTLLETRNVNNCQLDPQVIDITSIRR